MKKNIFILCITLSTIIFSIYAMENHELEEVTTLIDKTNHLLQLPPELLDNIIFRHQPTTLANISKTCKYLHKQASIMRMNEPIAIRYFMLNQDERPQFFQRITQLNNPDYIQEILIYGRKEAHIFNKPTATNITINKEVLEQNHIEKYYLPILLEKAIDNDAYYSVLTLVNNGALSINNNMTPKLYAEINDKSEALKALQSSSENIIHKGFYCLVRGMIATGIITLVGLAITAIIFTIKDDCIENATHHCVE